MTEEKLSNLVIIHCNHNISNEVLQKDFDSLLANALEGKIFYDQKIVL